MLFFARSVFYKLLFSIERILYCKIESVSYSHSYFEIHKVFKHAHDTCKCGCKWYVTQIHKINEKVDQSINKNIPLPTQLCCYELDLDFHFWWNDWQKQTHVELSYKL